MASRTPPTPAHARPATRGDHKGRPQGATIGLDRLATARACPQGEPRAAARREAPHARTPGRHLRARGEATARAPTRHAARARVGPQRGNRTRARPAARGVATMHAGASRGCARVNASRSAKGATTVYLEPAETLDENRKVSHPENSCCKTIHVGINSRSSTTANEVGVDRTGKITGPPGTTQQARACRQARKGSRCGPCQWAPCDGAPVQENAHPGSQASVADSSRQGGGLVARRDGAGLPSLTGSAPLGAH
jgi:hypothetical protein